MLGKVVNSYSWLWYKDRDIAIKEMDKSLIKYNETGVPIDIRPFFDKDLEEPCSDKEIEYIFNSKKYVGRYFLDSNKNPRSKISFPRNLILEIRKCLFTKEEHIINKSSKIQLPELRFVKNVNNDGSIFFNLEVLDYEFYSFLDFPEKNYLKVNGNICSICGLKVLDEYGLIKESCIGYYTNPVISKNIPICYNCKRIQEANNITIIR